MRSACRLFLCNLTHNKIIELSRTASEIISQSAVREEDKEPPARDTPTSLCLSPEKNDDEEDDDSCDEKTLNENLQLYLDIDEQEEKVEAYKAMIKEVNTKMQIKDERDYRINYILKKLVSCQKKRYIQDGFDLDLTYITTSVIAMGYPCSSLDQMYRNSMSEVQRFFKLRHPGHYKVYNLCSERKYNANSFERGNPAF
ncbi:MAG: hypothetical protein P4M11_13820 [Candidatus Pacebacteria bacterium]|nr:hypothetical protein [Candidatus Paceibacterota bacterium]